MLDNENNTSFTTEVVMSRLWDHWLILLIPCIHRVMIVLMKREIILFICLVFLFMSTVHKILKDILLVEKDEVLGHCFILGSFRSCKKALLPLNLILKYLYTSYPGLYVYGMNILRLYAQRNMCVCKVKCTCEDC